MAAPHLTFDKLTLARGLRVLVQDASMQILPGQIWGLYGANGAGKTSVLRAAAGLLNPLAGQVCWAPQSKVQYLAHDLALKPQDRARLLLPAKEIEAWDLQDLADLPVAYLSAGQKKRLALARRCQYLGGLWLLDEPFANLDQAYSNCLMDRLSAQAAAGGAAICTLHDRDWNGPEMHISDGRLNVV